MRSTRTGLAALGLATLLAACAGPFNAMNVAPGTARDDVIARAGKPTAVVALPNGGSRLQYSLQPFGQYAYMVDLDAAGKVVRSRQVLNETELQRIQPGWTRDDVLREFGPPARVDGVASWNGPVWTYRWKSDGDMFWFVYFDPQGRVGRSHPAMEFVNARESRD
jgi:hypothetical protein